jgi:glycerol-3-phosphate dehydrogenase (NAD(P)+)
VIDAAVLGAGAWGTAVALRLAKKGRNVLLWAYEPDLVAIIRETRENSFYLPGVVLPETIDVTDDLQRAGVSSDIVIMATPSFALRATVTQIAATLKNRRILILTKGLETDSLLRMSQVVEELIGSDAAIAVLSGPSFAREVAGSVFTSVVVASKRMDLARFFQELTHGESFRVYTNDDVTGIEIGGALKNVMAVGAGIIQGLQLGSNTLAAYITRALAEIKRLGKALGARETTFMGLSGIGDLILTCTGPLSRNRLFGIELSKGRKAADIVTSQRTVVEGYYTIDAAYRLSRSLEIEMPITEEIYKITYEGKDLRASIEDITRRDYKEEDA